MTALTSLLIVLILIIILMVSRIQGTARVVNYAGLVRGKTQRIIKLEDARMPQDDMIADVKGYIKGLRFGNSAFLRKTSLSCVRKTDPQKNIPVLFS